MPKGKERKDNVEDETKRKRKKESGKSSDGENLRKKRKKEEKKKEKAEKHHKHKEKEKHHKEKKKHKTKIERKEAEENLAAVPVLSPNISGGIEESMKTTFGASFNFRFIRESMHTLLSLLTFQISFTTANENHKLQRDVIVFLLKKSGVV